MAKLLLSLFVPSLLHQVTWKKLIIHWSLLAGQSGLKYMLHAIRYNMNLAYDIIHQQQYSLIKSKRWLNLILKWFNFQIIDEKSLIKKYQKEISILKEELDQLRQGMLVAVSHEEILSLRQKVLKFFLVFFFWILLCCFHFMVLLPLTNHSLFSIE